MNYEPTVKEQIETEMTGEEIAASLLVLAKLIAVAGSLWDWEYVKSMDMDPRHTHGRIIVKLETW